VSPIASLFTLRGRTGRGGFWAAGLVQIVVGLALALALGPTADLDWTNTSVADLLPWIAVAAVPAWIGFAATVRRWHDRDKSGWWCLVGAAPLIGPVWLAVELGLSPGTPGANRFGPPVGEAAARVRDEATAVDDGRLDDVVARWTASASRSAPAVSPPTSRPTPQVEVISRPSRAGFGRRGLPS